MTETKKKILWLCHWESPYEEEWRGGMGKYMYQLAKELSRDYKINIDILTPNFANYPSKQVLCSRVNLIRLDVPAQGNIRNPDDMQKFADSVVNFVAGKDYSLVHAHYWSSHYAGKALAEKGMPYVLQLHQLNKPMQVAFENYDLDFPLNEWRNEEERNAVESADRTIFVSNTQLEEFKRDYYNDKEIPKQTRDKIKIVLNGADLQYFKPVEGKDLENLMKKYDVPKDSFIIGYCGRLDPDKAVDRLIRSVPILLDKLPGEIADKVRIMITGKGSDVKYLESVTRDLKLDSRTQFYGFQTGKSLLEKFQISDVGVITSIHETFGLSVIEFMATGKPVVCWNGSGGPEEIINGTAGKVVSDYESAAEALFEFVMNPELKNKIGNDARDKCIKVYNWDRVAKEVNDVYNEILK
ncbi:MAG: glycosyltransferase family 4 protein [archaeon]|nr:glycosyltransferase family 4 protein [archaeon]